MVQTIAEIRKEIAEQRKRIAKEETVSKAIAEREKLSSELFKLKNRKLIGAGAKAKRLSGKFGKALLKVGKKVAPVVQKQAKLIREQQLRDDAILRARSKKSGKRITTVKTFVPVKGKGKKTLFKKVKVKVRIPKKSKKRSLNNEGIFGNLDF